jgi:hypothetical protein
MLSPFSRRFFVSIFAVTALIASTMQLSSAQLRQQIKNRVVDDVANQMVSQIQTDSCPEFQAMLKNARSNSGSSSGRASSMMKKDPAARERFVNKVAGPLLNKMIDCDLLPGK